MPEFEGRKCSASQGLVFPGTIPNAGLWRGRSGEWPGAPSLPPAAYVGGLRCRCWGLRVPPASVDPTPPAHRPGPSRAALIPRRILHDAVQRLSARLLRGPQLVGLAQAGRSPRAPVPGSRRMAPMWITTSDSQQPSAEVVREVSPQASRHSGSGSCRPILRVSAAWSSCCGRFRLCQTSGEGRDGFKQLIRFASLLHTVTQQVLQRDPVKLPHLEYDGGHIRGRAKRAGPVSLQVAFGYPN